MSVWKVLSRQPGLFTVESAGLHDPIIGSAVQGYGTNTNGKRAIPSIQVTVCRTGKPSRERVGL